MELKKLLKRYPLSVKLNDDTEVQIRLMGAKDGPAVLAFAKNLPADDLMFLRLDLTQPETVDAWVENIRNGYTTSLLALDGKRLVGYASVHRDSAPWTRRVGGIRVNIAPTHRALGLGRNLTSQIFDVARGLGLKKIVANMTDDQVGAKAAFKRLGFMPEALMADHVEDRQGRLRDLVVMSYDVDGLTDLVDEPLRM